MRPAGILGVVDVNGAKTRSPHHTVELSQHAVEIVHDIVSGIAHMAGIEAYTQAAVQLGPARTHRIDNRRELFKAASHLGTLARHGLEQHARALPLKHHLTQRIGDELDAVLDALAHMGARMEVIVIARQRLHTTQVFPHRLERELACTLFSRAGVIGIGSVRHEWPK